MLGALCFGLPQLCLPQGTDQPANSAALVRSGAALALTPEETTADNVADALDQLLGDPRYREAAERVRYEIEAMPDPDTVMRMLLLETS
jgi:UDP:flavonoid glycosyltransferase YjiC (YdhE family)